MSFLAMVRKNLLRRPIRSGLTALGIAVFFPLVRLVERLAPEISAQAAPGHIALVVAGAAAVSLLSSLLPIQRLRRIYPLEVFR